MDKLLLNRVAVWTAKSVDGLTVKIQPAGRMYFENEIAKLTNTQSYRYAKNFEIAKDDDTIKFCLMITSLSDSVNEIERFLDEVAERCDYQLIKKCLEDKVNINYIDEFYRKDN